MSEQRSSTLAIRVQNTGQVLILGQAALTIGRRPDNTIVLSDSLVSRQHARIEWQPQGPVIVDLGSTHGTYVNERRVSGPRLLQPGHVVRVGSTILEVEHVQQQPGAGPRQPAAAPARRGRAGAPGWLLIAGVAAGLVTALALLLAAGAAFLGGDQEAGSASTVLPVDAQGEDVPAVTAAPTVAEVATALPPATATASPVPPTAQPTAVPPTAAPPTAVPPTAAPPPTPDYPAPTLVAPTEDQASGVRGLVTFSWSYPRALNAGEGFQVLMWKDGQEHNGAAGLTRETQQTIDLDAVLPGRGGGGDYLWTVVVRRDAPGEALLSPEANPRRLVYTPEDSGPGPLPNECASFTCDGCDSWNSDNPLCTQCQCP